MEMSGRGRPFIAVIIIPSRLESRRNQEYGAILSSCSSFTYCDLHSKQGLAMEHVYSFIRL